MKTNIRWIGRVERPFDLVSKKLVKDADKIFRSATTNAEQQVEQKIVADLRTDVAGLKLQRDVVIEITNIKQVRNEDATSLVIGLEWKSAEAAYLFPKMQATLTVRPFGENTQLDFRGQYEPPFGVLGQTIDTMVGANVAESCVEKFVLEVLERLKAAVPENSHPENSTTDAI